MIKNKLNQLFAGSLTSVLLLTSGVLPVFAQSVTAGITADVNVSTGSTTKADARAALQAQVQTTRVNTAKARGNQEINRRIAVLNALSTRVQGMVRVSADAKASMAASITAEVGTLTSLQAKIAADTDITALKPDIQSITQSYRIFVLIIPQYTIAVTADRIQTTATMMSQVSAKFQTRITAIQTAGKDTSALVTLLADYNAKIADANTQSSAAVFGTASLVPDQGDQVTITANQSALMAARAQLKTATADLKTARQDAQKILQALKATPINVHVTASSTTQAQ